MEKIVPEAPHKYFVHPDDVRPYSPANHTGTVNRRLIGPETVGAERLEVLLGTLEVGGAARPHAHPGMEQVCFVLGGHARVDVGGQSRDIGPGECCFFPAGVEHAVVAVGEEPARLLVIYSPPYGEDPNKVERGSGL